MDKFIFEGNLLLPQVEIKNGLKQGETLAPFVFLLVEELGAR